MSWALAKLEFLILTRKLLFNAVEVISAWRRPYSALIEKGFRHLVKTVMARDGRV